MPQPDNAVFSGLPLTPTDFRDLRADGTRMRMGDLSAPAGRFVASFSAFVGTGDDRLDRVPFWTAADATFTAAVPLGTTPPELPPRAPTPPSEASVAQPPSGRVSTRTRRRTAAAAGAAQPAVDHGFEPVRVTQSSSFRVNPPPRAPRPRPPLAVAPSTSRAPTHVPTVPIPSDRDRPEPLGAPLLGLDSFGAFLRPYGRLGRPWRC